MADTPSFWRDILQTLFDNSENITIGVIAIMLLVFIGVFVRLLYKSGNLRIADRQDEREATSSVTDNLFSVIGSFQGIADSIKVLTGVNQEIKESMSQGRIHHIEEMGLLREAKTEVSEVLVNVMNIQDRLDNWKNRGRGVFVLDDAFNIVWYSDEAKTFIKQDLVKDPSFLDIAWYDLSKTLISDTFLRELVKCTPQGESLSFLKRPSSIIGLVKEEGAHQWYLIETYPHQIPSQPNKTYYLIVLQEFAELNQVEGVADDN